MNMTITAAARCCYTHPRYLLPPIIFFAGLSVKKKHFFRNLPTISAFGVLGTYVCFTIIALALYSVSRASSYLSLADCLALGAIFAATDSVAVLQVPVVLCNSGNFQLGSTHSTVVVAAIESTCDPRSTPSLLALVDTHCRCWHWLIPTADMAQVLDQDKKPLLFSLVFGEGIINDAVSIVLLAAVQVAVLGIGWPLCQLTRTCGSQPAVLFALLFAVLFAVLVSVLPALVPAVHSPAHCAHTACDHSPAHCAHTACATRPLRRWVPCLSSLHGPCWPSWGALPFCWPPPPCWGVQRGSQPHGC